MRRMRGIWSQLTVVALVTGLVAVLADCKPKAGGKCEAGQAACPTPGGATVLACVNGTFSEVPCRGPAGCFVDPSKKVICDDSVANDGDPCLTQENSSDACSVDKKQMVQCTDGKFKMIRQCRGPKSCTVSGDTVTCDNSLQLVGDPCGTLGTAVCTPDHKQRLVCKDSAWAVDRYCRGAKGCSTSGPDNNIVVNCDESIAELNDPCGVTGIVACSDDGKNELECRGGKFNQHRNCPKLGCHILANDRLECQ